MAEKWWNNGGAMVEQWWNNGAATVEQWCSKYRTMEKQLRIDEATVEQRWNNIEEWGSNGCRSNNLEMHHELFREYSC